MKGIVSGSADKCSVENQLGDSVLFTWLAYFDSESFSVGSCMGFCIIS